MHLNILSLLKIGFSSSLAVSYIHAFPVRKACIYDNILEIGNIGKGCLGPTYDHSVSVLAVVIIGNSKAEVLVGQEVNIPEKVELRQPVH